MFCANCGMKIPQGASCCTGCGSDVRIAEVDKIEVKDADSSDGTKHTLIEQWRNMGKLQKLFSLLWISVAVRMLLILVGYFDVKEYYLLGRVAYFVFNVILLAIWVWLIMALEHRKSWARKTFIVLVLLGTLLTFSDGLEISFVSLLYLVHILICLYCVYLCFGAEVTAVFRADLRLRGSRVAVSRHQCIAFCLSVGLLLLFGMIWGLFWSESDAGCEDCLAAAVDGSSSAREEFINRLAEEYRSEGLDNPVERATKVLDGIIEETKHEGDVDIGNAIREVSKVARSGGVISAAWRASTKVVALVGAFIVWLFNSFGLLKGSVRQTPDSEVRLK